MFYRSDVPEAFIQIINTPIWHVDIQLPFEIYYCLFIQPVGSTGPVSCQPAVRRIYICGLRLISSPLKICSLVRIQNYIFSDLVNFANTVKFSKHCLNCKGPCAFCMVSYCIWSSTIWRVRKIQISKLRHSRTNNSDQKLRVPIHKILIEETDSTQQIRHWYAVFFIVVHLKDRGRCQRAW